MRALMINRNVFLKENFNSNSNLDNVFSFSETPRFFHYSISEESEEEIDDVNNNVSENIKPQNKTLEETHTCSFAKKSRVAPENPKLTQKYDIPESKSSLSCYSDIKFQNLRKSSSHQSLLRKDLRCEQNQNDTEIKTGNLVMISESHSTSCTVQESRSMKTTLHLNCFTRSPVMVKVYKKRYEHYCIVTKSKKDKTQPLYINLKRCVVTSTSPCQIHVFVDGADGKSLIFETTCEDSARSWLEAFTSIDTFSQFSSRCATTKLVHTVSQATVGTSTSSFSYSSSTDRVCLPTNNSSSSPKIPRTPLMPALAEENEP